MPVNALTSSGSNSACDINDKLTKIKEGGKLVMGASPDYPPSELYMVYESGNKKKGFRL